MSYVLFVSIDFELPRVNNNKRGILKEVRNV